MSAIVGQGNIVVFGPQESYVENTGVGQRIPVSRRKGVHVLQCDAQAGSRTTKHVRLNEPNTNGERWLSGGQREPARGRNSRTLKDQNRE